MDCHITNRIIASNTETKTLKGILLPGNLGPKFTQHLYKFTKPNYQRKKCLQLSKPLKQNNLFFPMKHSSAALQPNLCSTKKLNEKNFTAQAENCRKQCSPSPFAVKSIHNVNGRI